MGIKKSIKSLLFVSALTLLSSCGGSSGGDKELFSSWTEISTRAALILTGGQFAVPLATSIVLSDRSQCNCIVAITGSQSSGAYVMNSCVYVAGTGFGNPGCNALNTTGAYTNNSGTLTTIDSSGGISIYR